jgi:hypothetical protein
MLRADPQIPYCISRCTETMIHSLRRELCRYSDFSNLDCVIRGPCRGESTLGLPGRGSCSSICRGLSDLGRKGSRGRVVEAASSESGGHPWLREQKLILFLTNLLAVPFTSKRFFHALLLAGLQVKRMTFYFLDDVFRLNLALEAPQCVFERLAFLHSNLCQGKYTSKSSQLGRLQNSAQSLGRKGISERFCGFCRRKASVSGQTQSPARLPGRKSGLGSSPGA